VIQVELTGWGKASSSDMFVSSRSSRCLGELTKLNLIDSRVEQNLSMTSMKMARTRLRWQETVGQMFQVFDENAP
jgi:hypothetical protein